MTTRDELVAAIAARYAQGDRIERGRILYEFAAVTGFHRKHAMRLLRAGRVNRRSGPRPGRRIYDDAVREALIVVWEASDRICGKRLRPLVPILVEAMERHGHLRLGQEVRTSLLAMSAATIDRALRDIRRHAGTAPRRRAAPSAAVRRSVPVRTFDGWDDPPPGFVEADLVAHSGPVARGSFVQTLVLTDIATGWTAKGAVRSATRTPSLRQRRTRGADRGLGGVGPGLRQAAAAAGAHSGRGDGVARPSPPRAGSSHQPTGDERGHHRSGIARRQAARGRCDAPQGGSFHRGQAQRAGAHV